MGWFSDNSEQADAYEQVTNAPHRAELSHELIAGAAAYAGAREYEKHCAENGKPDSHAEAKELMSGLMGAFIDRTVETKGLDFVDKERVKHEARQHVDEYITEEYN